MCHLSNISDPKGIVHICHGKAEHIGRYEWLISKLNDDGYHVISIDHRGHGKRIKAMMILESSQIIRMVGKW